MSKAEKLIRRFLAAPPPKDFTWDELVNLMSQFGYHVIENGSSHKKFFNKISGHYISGIQKPHGNRKHVLVCYLTIAKEGLISQGVLDV